MGRHYLDHEWGQQLMTLSKFIDVHVVQKERQGEMKAYRIGIRHLHSHSACELGLSSKSDAAQECKQHAQVHSLHHSRASCCLFV